MNIHRHTLTSLLLVAGFALSIAASAQNKVIAGAAFDDPISIQNVPLRINGSGVRYKAMFRVYAAALYTQTRSSTLDAALNQQGPKRLRLIMLRSVAADELGKLFVKGISDNVEKGQFSKLAPSIFAMGSVFAQHRELAAGDSVDIDWIPGSGTVIRVRDQLVQTFPDPILYQAMMRIWLGNSPADWKLKEALLGKSDS